MFEIILLSMGIALALSVDAFIACFAFSTNQVKVKKSYIYTPILIGVLHFVLPFISFTFCGLFREELETIGNIIGGVIFLVLGLMCFSKKDDVKCRILDFIGIVLLAVGVSIDSLLVGISLSFSLTSIIIPALIFGIISGFITFVSIQLGKKLCHIKFNWDIIAGLFFVLLGILTFFNVL
jgi:putative Mn2+ efflux pump MntP